MTILVPTLAVYGVADAVAMDIEPPLASPAVAVVTHLEHVVATVPLDAGAHRVELGVLPLGGYGITVRGTDGEAIAATAVDVLASRWDRPRYGFAVTLDGSLDPADVSSFFRRTHLTAALFYDWAYRHTQLVPPERHYVDPLGQPRDLDVVNAMARSLSAVGTAPLGYAAVYAIGWEEVEEWADALLLRPDGEPYRLGENFLVLVDPANPRWLAHMLDRLAETVEHTELVGFHLDQFGWPKFGGAPDGSSVSLAASFETFLTAVRERLPDSQFMFNNVNDFPTHRTAGLPQDATYIEVWEPHLTLGHLGHLATRARVPNPAHPPILSAYLACYTRDAEANATDAGKLVMATALSHGATHLLLGEAGNALTDPYYPRNHKLSAQGVEAYVPWYDFAVRYGDLFYGPSIADVTTHMTGGINEDVVVVTDSAPVRVDAEPGTVWTRVVETPEGLVVHIINLASQDSITWDQGKQPVSPIAGARLRLAFADSATSVQSCSPDAPDLVALTPLGKVSGSQNDALSAGQGGQEYELPVLGEWTVVLVRP